MPVLLPSQDRGAFLEFEAMTLSHRLEFNLESIGQEPRHPWRAVPCPGHSQTLKSKLSLSVCHGPQAHRPHQSVPCLSPSRETPHGTEKGAVAPSPG